MSTGSKRFLASMVAAAALGTWQAATAMADPTLTYCRSTGSISASYQPCPDSFLPGSTYQIPTTDGDDDSDY